MFALTVAATFLSTVILSWAAWVWPTLPFGFGSGFVRAIGFLLPLASLAALLGIVVALVDVLGKRHRTGCMRFLALAVAVVGGTAVGWWLGPIHKMERIRQVATSAQTLVRAIEAFERDNGRPPANLNEIVPRYIATIPPTGMRGYDGWDYLQGPDAQAFDDNTWVLRLHTGGPGINFDQLLYFPNQRYPQVGYGGWIERIGVWGYVHE